MAKQKPKILLCWGYHRKGWVSSFNKLSEKFDFTYLFFISKPEDEMNFAVNSDVIYWSDFKNAQHILNRIKPEKIVFMGIEGSNTTALNIIAKKKGIETFYLQHGMFHRFSDYVKWEQVETEERQKTGQFNRSAEEVDRFFLLSFFIRSVIFAKPSTLPYIFRLQYLKRKYYEITALQKLRSEHRIPSKYIVFTKDNASIFCERDGANSENFIEIGNPEKDDFFQNDFQVEKTSENYYLLIDEPWSEIKDYASPGFGISKEQTNNFYKTLSEFAKKKGAKLKIKLHPYSYKSDFFISDPNIEYIRDTDTKSLILNSKAVFGFSSTLLLPAIFFKKCCLFNFWEDMSFQRDLKELEIVQVLEYHQFTIDDIDFDGIEKTEEKVRRFVEKFLYKTDGNSVKRLEQVLSDNYVE